jgi:hypothetical protein
MDSSLLRNAQNLIVEPLPLLNIVSLESEEAGILSQHALILLLLLGLSFLKEQSMYLYILE